MVKILDDFDGGKYVDGVHLSILGCQELFPDRIVKNVVHGYYRPGVIRKDNGDIKTYYDNHLPSWNFQEVEEKNYCKATMIIFYKEEGE